MQMEYQTRYSFAKTHKHNKRENHSQDRAALLEALSFKDKLKLTFLAAVTHLYGYANFESLDFLA
jgi:hypothetical protein